MRKSYRERPVSELLDPDIGIDQFFDQTNRHKKMPSKWLPDPDKLLENKEFWEVFRDCKDKLPSLINDAFTLKEIEQMESAEICMILNITQANYWVLLHRARLQLRQCLEGNWFEISEDH